MHWEALGLATCTKLESFAVALHVPTQHATRPPSAPLAVGCAALVRTLSATVRDLTVSLHRVHALAQVCDATALGLGALDSALADQVAFPALRRVVVVVLRASACGIHRIEADAALRKSMPRLTEGFLEVECDEYVHWLVYINNGLHSNLGR